MLKNKTIFNAGTIALVIVLAITILLISVSLATNKVENELENEIVEMKLERFYSPLDEVWRVSANFGTRMHPITKETLSHNGVDLVSDEGTEVLATAEGIVLKTGYDAEKGNFIEIQHKDLVSEYCHLSKIDTQAGSNVSSGEKIGEVGATGRATGPHLHFALRNGDNEYVDPMEYVESK